MKRTGAMKLGLAGLLVTAMAVPVVAQGWGQPGRDGAGRPNSEYGRAVSGGPFGPLDGPPADFATLDADGDGLVTRAELQAYRSARFAAADSDGNGMLSVEEMVAAREAQRLAQVTARAERTIVAFDADGDGGLSKAELPGNQMAGTMILRLDTDGDGAVSQAEFEAARNGFGARGPDGQRNRP
jgi:hypothetical protein